MLTGSEASFVREFLFYGNNSFIFEGPQRPHNINTELNTSLNKLNLQWTFNDLTIEDVEISDWIVVVVVYRRRPMAVLREEEAMCLFY